MLNIALVTPVLPVPHDPARGRYIHETAKALGQLARVRVYFTQPRYPRLPGLAPRSFLGGSVGDDFRLDGLDLETVSYPAIPGLSRIANGAVAGRALSPRVRRFAPDLVLAYWVYPDGSAALRTARSLGVPCVIGALGSDIHVRSRLNTWLTCRTMAGADALLTVSDAMRETAIRDYGVGPGKVHTIINGFDSHVFHPRAQGDMRERLGIAADARLILYVGRFVEAKGMLELLAAFQTLSAGDACARLALVGDGVMREEIERRIGTMDLTGKVLLPGGMAPAQVAEWIGASDLLTLPSWSEGYPNVLVEAIACGRPVVATDVGGTREILRPSNGLLIPARDADALAAALARALASPWDYAAIAAGSRRSWDDVARETLDVCEQVVAGARATT